MRYGPRRTFQLGTSLLASWLFVMGMNGRSHAQDTSPDKSGYTLFNPVPDEKLRSFATDRPTKSNIPNTVDAGHFQAELDIVNYFNRQTKGITTTSLTALNSFLKVGVSHNIDLEISPPAPQVIATHMPGGGQDNRATGFNDTIVRAKVNLWGNDGGSSAFALIPNLKVPTAPIGLGNGAVEGGIIAPLSFSLPNDFTLLFNSEFDAFRNGHDGGYHFNTFNLVNLSHPLGKDITLYGEFWSAANFDPARTITQYSVDTAISWAFEKNAQVDIGLNVGLNPDTPRYQIYSGYALRY